MMVVEVAMVEEVIKQSVQHEVDETMKCDEVCMAATTHT